MAREFVTTGDLRIEEEIDLEKCKTDPIQQTAMIQPRGVFFQFDPETLTVLACSDNLQDYLDVSPRTVIRNHMETAIGQSSITSLQQSLEGPTSGTKNFLLEANDRQFLARVFPIGQTAGIELEPHEESDRSSTEFVFRENTVFNRISESDDKQELLNNLAGIVKVMLDYDRVIVLEFEHQGHGHVVAESKNKNLRSYMDQYFPASDIPEPARRIFRKNGLRYIPEAQYDPAPVVDREGQLDREELDLTYSDLRNVPLIHRKYLKNMGVAASTSVPLLIDDELWGLVTAHDTHDGFVHWQTRHLCSRIGKIASTKIERIETEEREQMHQAVEVFREDNLKSENLDRDLFEFLRRTSDEVLKLLKASGFFIKINGRSYWMTDGKLQEPSEALQDWIESKLETQAKFRVNSIADELQLDLEDSDYYGGFLALHITQSPENYCVWFRPEQESKIKWGGDPRSPLTVNESNELNPRNSFEEWTQVVQGQCKRWTEVDLAVASDLINMFNEVALEEQSKRLSESNVELEAQNDELQHIKSVLEEKNQELEEANERLEELSYYDELTGIPNRRQFEETLKSKWKLLERNNQSLSLIMIDIDFFKEFNDMYGHGKGDECLQKVSRVLRDTARRESDTVARYGGEEFVVVLPDVDREDAVGLAESMRQAIKDLGVPHDDSDVAKVVTISLGVASLENLCDSTRDALLQKADEALYEAKESGRDRVKLHGR